MIKIVHRYVNGAEVTCNDLAQYKITNPVILSMIRNAIRRNSQKPAPEKAVPENIS